MNHVVKRDDFLRALNEVRPGLSVKPILEQAAAFVFKNGRVWTFNDEVMCSARSGLPKEFTAVVRAKLMLNLVQKAEEDTLTLACDKGEFGISGKKWRSGLAADPEVLLDLKKVTMPKQDDWFPVADEFCEAVQLVQECAGKDQQQFVLTCVHIHPKWVEASDNSQIARFNCKTGVKEAILVRRDSVKPIPQYDITKMAVHENWVHFGASNGTVISIARFADKFYDLTEMLGGEGVKVTLPKTLGDLTERAKLVSDETEEDRVKVTLRQDRVTVHAKCDSGWFEAGQKARYAGPKFSFLISPKMLVSLVDKYPDAIIDTENYRIRASGGKFQYAACLDVTLTDDRPKESE